MSEGYIMHIKSKASLVMHVTEENNVLPSQAITSDVNEEVLARAAATLSLVSPLTDSSTTQNLSQSLVKMKCYYQHTNY